MIDPDRWNAEGGVLFWDGRRLGTPPELRGARERSCGACGAEL